MRRYLPTGSRGGATFIDASRAVGDLESICTNGLQGGAAVAEEVVTGEGTRGAGAPTNGSFLPASGIPSPLAFHPVTQPSSTLSSFNCPSPACPVTRSTPPSLATNNRPGDDDDDDDDDIAISLGPQHLHLQTRQSARSKPRLPAFWPCANTSQHRPATAQGDTADQGLARAQAGPAPSLQAAAPEKKCLRCSRCRQHR